MAQVCLIAVAMPASGGEVSGALYRLGAFAARHRLLVVTLLWILFAVAMVGWVRLAGAKTNNNLTLPGTDSQHAFDILAQKFPPQQNGANPFVFEAPHGKLTDPEFKQAMDADRRSPGPRPPRVQRDQPDQQEGAGGRLAVQGRNDRLRSRPAQRELRLHHGPARQRYPRRDRSGAEGRHHGRGRWLDRQHAVGTGHEDLADPRQRRGDGDPRARLRQPRRDGNADRDRHHRPRGGHLDDRPARSRDRHPIGGTDDRRDDRPWRGHRLRAVPRDQASRATRERRRSPRVDRPSDELLGDRGRVRWDDRGDRRSCPLP